MHKVAVLMKMELVDQFMGKSMKCKTCNPWLEVAWGKILNYIPRFHILVREWIRFEMRNEMKGWFQNGGIQIFIPILSLYIFNTFGSSYLGYPLNARLMRF